MTDKDMATDENKQDEKTVTTETKSEDTATAKPEQNDGMVSASVLEAERAKRAEAEKTANDLAAEAVAEVPEQLRSLMPQNATAAEKIAWVKEAKSAGIFGKKADVPPTDDGEKPGSAPKHQEIDPNSLPIGSPRIAAALRAAQT